MKSIIHVNQHVIRSNIRSDDKHPPLTIKTYKSNVLAKEAEIIDEDGRVVARIVYRPEKPLSCGARVWIETQLDVRAK